MLPIAFGLPEAGRKARAPRDVPVLNGRLLGYGPSKQSSKGLMSLFFNTCATGSTLQPRNLPGLIYRNGQDLLPPIGLFLQGVRLPLAEDSATPRRCTRGLPASAGHASVPYAGEHDLVVLLTVRSAISPLVTTREPFHGKPIGRREKSIISIMEKERRGERKERRGEREWRFPSPALQYVHASVPFRGDRSGG
jgi:hypothetical protein